MDDALNPPMENSQSARGSTVNRHGLSRYIRAEIRREVRQRCGFGCVVCGLGLYDYEHFDPDFKHATEHNPNGITLLCMQCNQKRARGQLSRETVAEKNTAPFCMRAGFAREGLDIGARELEVVMGNVGVRGFRQLVTIGSVNILSIRPSEEPGEPLLLSGMFTDVNGGLTLRIVDNQWMARIENWDVEVNGPVLTIRRAPRDIALQIRVEPPNELHIQRLNMRYKNWWLDVSEDAGIQHSSDGGRTWGGSAKLTLIGNDDPNMGCVHYQVNPDPADLMHARKFGNWQVQ